MSIFLGIIAIISGILAVINPAKMTMIGGKWRYEEEGPSEMNIKATKIIGIISIIFGIVFILFI